MKHHAMILIACALFCVAAGVHAQVPRTIGFQGVLGDGTGAALADGAYSVTFRLYDQSTGGSPLWTETQTLPVRDGVFDARLGAQTPLTAAFDRAYWLGLSVDGGAELVPRTTLASVPYAFHALQADVATALSAAATGVVQSVNDADGAITLVGGGTTTVTRSGKTITIASTGGSGGTGIQGVQSTNQTLDITNGTGPVATINVSAGGIGTAQLADGAVTSEKIADGTIQADDIANGSVPALKLSGAGAASGQVLFYDGRSVGWTSQGGGVSGSGAVSQVALWNGATSLNGNANLVYGAGKLGVGTAAPKATLDVRGDDGILSEGNINSGTTHSLGAGTRMHWYPRQAAFRAGAVNGTQWDNASIGTCSIALGNNCTASGTASIALGSSVLASGTGAVAIGNSSTANGHNALATGYGTTASGQGSTSMGQYVSTNAKPGAFIIGDGSTSTVLDATASNQMSMRFNGGYRLYSNNGCTTGVYMNGGASGWTNYSDRNRKENFIEIDGEELLAKIRLLPVSEWNYKYTDPTVRYIGPMAQDFWQAFRLGGTDSLGINSIAIDGVNLAAVRALEARTAELREKTARIEELEARIVDLEARMTELAAMRSELDVLRTLLRQQLPIPTPRRTSLPHPEE